MPSADPKLDFQQRIKQKNNTFHLRRYLLYITCVVIACAAVHKIYDVPIPVIAVFLVIIVANVYMIAHMLSAKELKI
jgi:uncharacterized membrane protein